MNFFHCNKCCHIPDCHGPRRYFLTSCGHVLCESCRQGSGACPVCEQQARLVEINGEAKQDIKMYFSDPMELLQNSLKQWSQVYKFQQTQQKNFKTILVKMIQQNHSMKKEIETLKAEIAKLQKKLEQNLLKEQSILGNGLLGFDNKTSSKEPVFSLLGPGKSNFTNARVTMHYGSPASPSPARPSPLGNPIQSRAYGSSSGYGRFSNLLTGRGESPGSGTSDIISRFKHLR